MSHSDDSAAGGHSHKSLWLWVMCLTGVDYFSSLAYQPSIAFVSAGMLAPLATVALVLVTLFGALPVYVYVAKKSFTGQGSIGMLAKIISGWPSKILVLILLGFAATDFVITKTLSAADAAQHMIANPVWPGRAEAAPEGASAAEIEQIAHAHKHAENRQRMIVTIGLLVLLGAMFMRGFREVVGLAVLLVGVYLLLNLIIVVNSSFFLFEHPDRIELWLHRLQTGDWHIAEAEVSGTGLLSIVAISVLIFPKLALGLSGFETGVAVMPLIQGDADDTHHNPKGRIRNTRKLLIAAAAIMSFFLLTSSLIVCTLIPPEAFAPTTVVHSAKDRALAYLAHGEGPDKIALSGEVFGTVYDISTIVILWFAGASAMAGLLNLVPQYLPRFGMAPEWALAIRPLVLLLTGINILVTWIFKADVDAQGGAYATGVLVLITSGCVATVIERYRENTAAKSWIGRCPWAFVAITVVFVYTTAANIYEKPEGIKIAAFFIFTILTTSFVSRVFRSREMRFKGFHIPDAMSKLLWDTIKHLEISVLVPHRPGRRSLPEKEGAIRREHRIPRDVTIIFVEVELADTSEFLQEPWLEIREEEGRHVMKITHAASIAHTLAAVSMDMAKVGRPPEIHFGWTDETPWSGTLGFLLFGEGNIPWMVRELIRRAEPDESRRPFIVVAGV